MAKKRFTRDFKRGKRRARRLKHVEGMDPALVKALEEGLDKAPTVADAQQLQMGMMSEVLQRMVEIRLAQWVESVLKILRDEFGFDEGQLARFAQSFMSRTRNEQEAQAAGDSHK